MKKKNMEVENNATKTPDSEENFGADIDEQEMNGLYGMLETETEDRLDPQ